MTVSWKPSDGPRRPAPARDKTPDGGGRNRRSAVDDDISTEGNRGEEAWSQLRRRVRRCAGGGGHVARGCTHELRRSDGLRLCPCRLRAVGREGHLGRLAGRRSRTSGRRAPIARMSAPVQTSPARPGRRTPPSPAMRAKGIRVKVTAVRQGEGVRLGVLGDHRQRVQRRAGELGRAGRHRLRARRLRAATSTTGTFDAPKPTYTYQWQSCTNRADAGTCFDITGATRATYTAVSRRCGQVPPRRRDRQEHAGAVLCGRLLADRPDGDRQLRAGELGRAGRQRLRARRLRAVLDHRHLRRPEADGHLPVAVVHRQGRRRHLYEHRQGDEGDVHGRRRRRAASSSVSAWWPRTRRRSPLPSPTR